MCGHTSPKVTHSWPNPCYVFLNLLDSHPTSTISRSHQRLIIQIPLDLSNSTVEAPLVHAVRVISVVFHTESSTTHRPDTRGICVNSPPDLISYIR